MTSTDWNSYDPLLFLSLSSSGIHITRDSSSHLLINTHNTCRPQGIQAWMLGLQEPAHEGMKKRKRPPTMFVLLSILLAAWAVTYCPPPVQRNSVEMRQLSNSPAVMPVCYGISNRKWTQPTPQAFSPPITTIPSYQEGAAPSPADRKLVQPSPPRRHRSQFTLLK